MLLDQLKIMKRGLEILGMCLGLFALITQFILMMQNRETDVPETIIRFFGFFTILTNTLVTLFFISKVFKETRFLSFLKGGSAFTAITTFILIVGLVYQTALRSVWDPKGLQMVVDELLHTIIPLFFLMYWFLYARLSDMELKSVIKWLVYPIGYLIFVFIQGAMTDFYPYPFLNVTEIGLSQSLINVGLVTILTLVFMFLLTVSGKFIVRNKKQF